MDDRRLLEMAAKAAGISLADEVDSHIPSGGVWIVGRGGRDTVWDPLRDDGDALRLAVKLHFTVRCYMGNTCVQTTVPGGPSVMVDETNHDDPAAATRRAITRAAAAIGEGKP